MRKIKVTRLVREERLKDHKGLFYRAGLEIKAGPVSHCIWMDGEELRPTKEDALIDCESLAFSNGLTL